MNISRVEDKTHGDYFLLKIIIEREEFYPHAISVARDLINTHGGGVYRVSVPPWSPHYTITLSLKTDLLKNDLIESLLNIEEVGMKKFAPQRESLKVSQ